MNRRLLTDISKRQAELTYAISRLQVEAAALGLPVTARMLGSAVELATMEARSIDEKNRQMLRKQAERTC